MANRAAFIETEKGAVVVRDAEIAQPEEGEVLINVHPTSADGAYDGTITLTGPGTSVCHPACRH